MKPSACPDSDYLVMRVLIQHSGKENKVYVCKGFVLVWIHILIQQVREVYFVDLSSRTDKQFCKEQYPNEPWDDD
ncbi:MAG: hypothetical protein C0582_01650 [Alphaproteobacteria bacterium]|nr:MAG: hypothetical protein C0582_01650 [Alphaproteobacteria bacterium]